MAKTQKQMTIPGLGDMTDIVEGVEDAIDEYMRQRLMQLADDLISWSPVWSGAYVKSHTIMSSKSASGGRSRTSKKQPVRSYVKGDNGNYKLWGDKATEDEARKQLYSDIAKLPKLDSSSKIRIINRARMQGGKGSHADAVELKHRPFAKVKNKYG